MDGLNTFGGVEMDYGQESHLNTNSIKEFRLLVPNQHIRKHNFDWCCITRELLESNPDKCQDVPSWKMK